MQENKGKKARKKEGKIYETFLRKKIGAGLKTKPTPIYLR
jgi:hypothetical protein